MARAGSTPAARLVLVTVDTLRADHVGAYGGPVGTPALDGLARDGVLVDGACTPTPSTGPAHASLFTGLHPWHHQVLDNAVELGPEWPRLAGRLQAAGFATAAFVSSYIVHPRFGLAQGFDHYGFEPSEAFHWRGQNRPRFWTRGEHVVRDAMRWITLHADESFFVWVHLFDPHAPYAPPVGYALPASSPVDLSDKRVPAEIKGRRQLADLVRAYRGEVRYADAQIGRLVERLRMLGLLETTAVVVTSDHGEGLGDHGLLAHGKNLHDELVRVPLVVRAPGLSAGRRLVGAAQLEDLMPTLLALVGVPQSPGLDGVDLLPWLQGRVEESPRSVVVGRRKPLRARPTLYFARDWPEKWIGPGDGAGVRYRLDEDPRELAGRPSSEPPDALREALAVGEVSTSPVQDPEVREALEALGYVE
jgi:arylsulfatase A-like enzyme